jgi:hypothetical protein
VLALHEAHPRTVEVAVTEREIRRALREIFEDLDRAARRVILPAALGAGMALSAGCGGRVVPATDGGRADQPTQGRADAQRRIDGQTPPPPRWDLSGPLGADHGVPPPVLMYMPAWHEDAKPPTLDVGPATAYSAPMPAPDAK